MNRTLALFLTLAILLAHMLAIHMTLAGQFAPPYDDAHVAFRVARNLVETQRPTWDASTAAVESFSSFLWVGVAAIGQRLGFTVTTFCQSVGGLSALITVFVLARFSPGRLAGVIAPILFVVAGGIASAAASGAATATLALFIAASFLFFERRAGLAFAICLCLCVVTRSEGVTFALLLLLLEIAGTLRHSAEQRANLLRWFIPAGVVLALMAVSRQMHFGTYFSPYEHAWASSNVERLETGASFLLGFARSSGWTILLVFPLYYLVRGQLQGVGRRALFLSLGYAAAVAIQGGGQGPMFQAMVPMTALLLIAIQQAMTLALDSSRRLWPQVTWVLFLFALATTALASKYPGNLGPFPTETLHRRWLQSGTSSRVSYVEPLGRLGLVEEIEVTERLRGLGAFMNAQFDPRDTVLTPWPGAIGYLSRLHVFDALGRTTLLPGETVPRPWTGTQRSDLLALLATDVDYIVPGINWYEAPPSLREIADNWQRFIDNQPIDTQRTAAVHEALRAFELITVPVPIYGSAAARPPTRPFHLLRRRALQLWPKLAIELDGSRYRVNVIHRSHEQMVDLRVILRERNGQLWSVLPTGALRSGASGLMRTSILLFHTDVRAIELAAGDLPDDLDVVEIRVVLRNPLARAEHPFAMASETVSLEVAR